MTIENIFQERGDKSPHKLSACHIESSHIQGQEGKQLTAKDAYHIGRAFGTVITACGGQDVTIGKDNRKASNTLYKAITTGLTESGINAQIIDNTTTPQLFFSCRALNTHAGVMVSSQLNNSINQLTFSLGQAPFFGKDLKFLQTLISNQSYAKGFGTIKENHIPQSYIHHLQTAFSVPPAARAIWQLKDTANSPVLKKVIENLEGHHTIASEQTSHQDLISKQRQEQANLVIIIKGDGNHLELLDHQGQRMKSQEKLYLLAKDGFKSNPEQNILCDIFSSNITIKALRQENVPISQWKACNAELKNHTQENGAAMAITNKGLSAYNLEGIVYEDAVLTALHILKIATQNKKLLRPHHLSVPECVNNAVTKTLLLSSQADKITSAMQNLEKKLKNEKQNYTNLDGLLLSTTDYSWVVKPYINQKYIKIKVEATDQQTLDHIASELQNNLIEKHH